jgi:hypothetical protein
MIVLRMLAAIVAIGGIVDPSIQVTRTEPLQVRLFAASDDPDAVAAASRLRSSLSGRADFVDAGEGAATVVVGPHLIAPVLEGSGPISVISLEEPPSVAIVEAPATVTLIPGSAVDIPVTLQAIDVTGKRSVAVLQQDGVELARAEHLWQNDGRATITLRYVAVAQGARRLTVRVQPLPGERRIVDNEADVLAMAAARPGVVAVIEPRPSWPAGFVRRELEADPAFEVSSVIRTSRGISSRAGDTPPVIQASQLSRFDVVIAGAPEDLRREEVEALWQFVDRRGGTLVLLPDRMPAGPYAERLPGKVSEHLLGEPRSLEPAGVLASELLTMTALPRGGRAIAALNGAPVIVSWPVGDGRIILSGALDAWRYRTDPKSHLASVWRDELLTAALHSPPPIAISLHPAVVRPGTDVHVEVRLRRTEWADPGPASGPMRLPGVAARISDSSGQLETIRLWPSAEPGLFEGELSVAAAGIHAVRVETDQHAAETALLADAAAALPASPPIDPGPVAMLTGGVIGTASEMSRVVEHLSSLPRGQRPESIRPFESAWWTAIFAGLLCGEWALRRRAGQR